MQSALAGDIRDRPARVLLAHSGAGVGLRHHIASEGEDPGCSVQTRPTQQSPRQRRRRPRYVTANEQRDQTLEGYQQQ